MEIISHLLSNSKIAELTSKEALINSVEDGTDILGNLYYQGIEKVIIHKENITPEFFDLKTKMAGEILQKFSNYQVRLAIVGDFHQVESKSLKDFIRESNRGMLVCFVGSVEEALTKLAKN